jgi:hypothetical protein
VTSQNARTFFVGCTIDELFFGDHFFDGGQGQFTGDGIAHLGGNLMAAESKFDQHVFRFAGGFAKLGPQVNYLLRIDGVIDDFEPGIVNAVYKPVVFSG